MKKYQIIEHTADIGIKIHARDLKELFCASAAAMFDIIAKKTSAPRSPAADLRAITVKQRADNAEELFINWLNELLSLSAVKEAIFSKFRINKLDANTLEAIVTGSDIKNYEIKMEIKAATYHQLKIEKRGRGYTAEVIFDV